MADGLTSSVQAPFVAGASGNSQKLSPTILDLGADTLTYNPVRQAIGGLFSPASSGGFFRGVNGFVAVATSSNLPSGSSASQNAAAQAYNSALQLVRRETPAEAYLKYLLSQTAAPPVTPAAAPPPPVTPKITTNKGASVVQGATTFINSDALSSNAGGAPNIDVVYNITGGPSNGYLALAYAPNTPIASFTQNDIVAGLVEYVNNGKPQTGDSFTFTVSDGAPPVTKGTFNISITPPAIVHPPQLVANTGTSVGEGGSTVITSAQLQTTDSYYGAPRIDYYVTSQPLNGQLELSTNPGVAATHFTQQEIDAGQLVYKHNGSDTASDSFTFNVVAGASKLAGNTFNISVGQAAPDITANTGATVNEGSSVTLTTANLSAADTGVPDSGLVYTVTSAPANGILQLASAPGTAITSFTQADLAAGNVQYVHNGSETTADSFSFSVADSADTTATAAGTFNIAVNAITPEVTVNAGASVNEGASVTLTTANLSASDAGVPDSSLTYNVTSQPANGYLQLASNPGTAITSFTQADIAAGNVQYVHNNSETTSDSFTFTVSDGTDTSAAATFNIAVNSGAPAITTNTGATVAEGSSVTLTTANLSASDAGLPDSGFTYNVTSAPANGYLQLASNPGIAITSFTQADLAAGTVQYVHNGSETTSDSFGFSVSDAQDVSPTTGTFNITVTSVAPAITVNTGAAVNEGSSVTLTTSNLSASDSGVPDSSLTYNVTSSPTNGILQLSTNPGTAITSFTQADLAAGRVQYVHSGSETTSDFFAFSVSDGTDTSSSATFNIAVNSVGPDITANTGATVTEGSSVTISASNLSASDAGQPDSGIVFSVTSAPQNGYLQLASAPGTAITSFTQADLAAGNVQYVHNGSEATSDSFTFAVADSGDTSSSAGTFNINVTSLAPAISTNAGATVTENSSVTLTTANLNATDAGAAPSDLVYNITSAPAFGILQLSTNPGSTITSFTEADLQAGRVQYVHFGSESPTDTFNFNVSDSGSASSSATFNITVTPIAPTITTNAGATVNEGSSVTLTTANLSSSDPGEAASSFVYSVTSSPANGILQFSSNPGVAITSFTQADLAAGKVQYVHNGSETTADAFQFNVSDGSATSAANAFNITVAPIPPAITTNSSATVTEGSSVTLTTSNLSASDAGVASSSIVFNVTSAPTGGRLQLSTNPGVSITSFTQADLAAGRVQYVNSGNSESTTDAFTFTVSDGSATSSPATFNINVTPVPPTVTANTGTTVSRLAGSTIITTAQLNASDAGDAASQIIFNVTGGLTKGYLDLSTAPGTQITSFTEAQLQAGIVQYVHTAFGLAADSFTFTVGDGGATSSTNTFNVNVTI